MMFFPQDSSARVETQSGLMDSRLNLALVAGAPGALQYLAHVQKRAQ